MGGRMSYREAREAADAFLAETGKFFSRVEVAGSVRRLRPTCKDVDVVGVVSDVEGLSKWIEMYIIYVNYYGKGIRLRTGPVELRFRRGMWAHEYADREAPPGTPETLKFIAGGQPVDVAGRASARLFWRGVEFDLWLTNDERYAMILLVRTGPNRARGVEGPGDPGALMNQALATRAIRQGKSFKVSGSIYVKSTQQELFFDTEEEVFKALWLPYCPPEWRDHPDWIALIWSDKRVDGGFWVPGLDAPYKAAATFEERSRLRQEAWARLPEEEREARAAQDMVDLFGEV